VGMGVGVGTGVGAGVTTGSRVGAAISTISTTCSVFFAQPAAHIAASAKHSATALFKRNIFCIGYLSFAFVPSHYTFSAARLSTRRRKCRQKVTFYSSFGANATKKAA